MEEVLDWVRVFRKRGTRVDDGPIGTGIRVRTDYWGRRAKTTTKRLGNHRSATTDEKAEKVTGTLLNRHSNLRETTLCIPPNTKELVWLSVFDPLLPKRIDVELSYELVSSISFPDIDLKKGNEHTGISSLKILLYIKQYRRKILTFKSTLTVSSLMNKRGT